MDPKRRVKKERIREKRKMSIKLRKIEIDQWTRWMKRERKREVERERERKKEREREREKERERERGGGEREREWTKRSPMKGDLDPRPPILAP